MPETTTETPEYEVGAILEYRPMGGGSLRRVRVTTRQADVKDGYPGFDGVLLNLVDAPVPDNVNGGDLTVWGYDDQIVAVVERAPAGGQQ